MVAELIAEHRPATGSIVGLPEASEGGEILSPRGVVLIDDLDLPTFASEWLDYYFEPLGIPELAPHTLLPVAHTYQPPREYTLLSQTATGERADIVKDINNDIFEKCYRPMFVEHALRKDEISKPGRDESIPLKKKGEIVPSYIPPGMIVSMYGTLREWIKGHRPDEYQKMIENMQDLGENAPYQILGDPYLHIILPLETEETQDMLIRIGKRAFEDDFGFSPKGFWLPESAVSLITLAVLARNGYKFVVLRDSQMQSNGANPINVSIDDHGTEQKIAVVHVDSNLSGEVSFNNDATIDAPRFLDNIANSGKMVNGYATDTEWMEWHKEGKLQFLYKKTDSEELAKRYLAPFDVREALKRLKENPVEGAIWEQSSWSDETSHKLGRWRGDPVCTCDGDRSFDGMSYKRMLYLTLKRYGIAIETKLTESDPLWRDRFVEFFNETRRSMYFDGNIDDDVDRLVAEGRGLSVLADPEIKNLYYAELARLTGMTSCFNFFGGKDRPEREIALTNIKEIEQLLPGIDVFKPTQDEINGYINDRLNGVQIAEDSDLQAVDNFSIIFLKNSGVEPAVSNEITVS